VVGPVKIGPLKKVVPSTETGLTVSIFIIMHFSFHFYLNVGSLMCLEYTFCSSSFDFRLWL
jgi:hypothetical protein